VGCRGRGSGAAWQSTHPVVSDEVGLTRNRAVGGRLRLPSIAQIRCVAWCAASVSVCSPAVVGPCPGDRVPSRR
jgi:hypothetical protein